MKTNEELADEALARVAFIPWHHKEVRASIIEAINTATQQQEAELEKQSKQIATLEMVMETQREQLEKLREDKEALDWLEETETSVGYNVENGQWGVDFEAPYGKTIREAIANARKGESK